ncbi:MAG: prepilin-type N-terminal cleavage/methylation domain-containing protein [Candidatus Riflebacteria bacterium]|nr:prepilin-type N-terminal cleavage/methylation domain-containing protein [Candidatus Riflebacteria bacterium]
MWRFWRTHGRTGPRGWNAPRGAFSLLEVLIAVVVIALALVPIFSVMTTSHKDVRSAMEEVIASNLASELLETLQALPAPLIPLGHAGELQAGAFAAAEAAGYRTTLADCPPGFTRHLFVELLPIESSIPAGLPREVQERAASASAVIEMRVEIRWQKQGRDRTLFLVTTKGRY